MKSIQRLIEDSGYWSAGMFPVFYNQETYELLPDDFKIEVGYEGNPFSELFLKLETFFSCKHDCFKRNAPGWQHKTSDNGTTFY